jgi:uncharacterized integral membrane protein
MPIELTEQEKAILKDLGEAVGPTSVEAREDLEEVGGPTSVEVRRESVHGARDSSAWSIAAGLQALCWIVAIATVVGIATTIMVAPDTFGGSAIPWASVISLAVVGGLLVTALLGFAELLKMAHAILFHLESLDRTQTRGWNVQSRNERDSARCGAGAGDGV